LLKGCLTVLTALAVLSVPPAAFGQEKEFDKTALPNGMTVLTQRCGGDLISACLFIDVGSADESPENNGISKLLAQVLLSCYPLGNASPPPLKVEQLGGRVTVDVRQDFTCYTLVAPAQKFWDALKVLAEALKAPQCVDAAVGQEKTALAAARNRAEDRLEEKGLRTFMRVSYGGMTYGLDPDGSEKGLAAVGRAELVNWHRSYYKPPNMLLSVCGRLVTAQTVKQVEEAFTDWPVISTKKAGTSRHGGEGIRSGTHVEESRSGSAVVMGYTSPRTGSPDYPSMLAVEAMLVDGMGSGVFRALRDKNVLAYNFGGLLPPMRDTSRLVFYDGRRQARRRGARDRGYRPFGIRRQFLRGGTAEGEGPRGGRAADAQGDVARQGVVGRDVRVLRRRGAIRRQLPRAGGQARKGRPDEGRATIFGGPGDSHLQETRREVSHARP